jgi:hypothetical protein
MKRNATLHNHGQGRIRIQEGIGECRNKLDLFKKKKNGFAWNLVPAHVFAELFSGMQMNSDINA